ARSPAVKPVCEIGWGNGAAQIACSFSGCRLPLSQRDGCDILSGYVVDGSYTLLSREDISKGERRSCSTSENHDVRPGACSHSRQRSGEPSFGRNRLPCRSPSAG